MWGVGRFVEGNKVRGSGLGIVVGCRFSGVGGMILMGERKGVDVL